MTYLSPGAASSLLAVALASLHGTTSEAGKAPEPAGDERSRQLEATLRRTAAAIQAVTSGDPEPYVALWDDGADISLYGAWERGADALREWVGRRFGPAGGLTCEHTEVHRSGSLACTVGFEHGSVQVDGRPPVPMRIRVTHIYRHADGEWRLIHRHADFPASDGDPRTAARLTDAGAKGADE